MTTQEKTFMSEKLKAKIVKLYFEDNVTSWIELARLLESEFNREFPPLSTREIAEKIRIFIRRKKKQLERDGVIKSCSVTTNTPNTPDISNTPTNEQNPGPRSVEYKTDGSVIFDDVIALAKGELITPEIIMNAHHLDPSKWEVLALKSNVWNAQGANDNLKVLYQSKLTVKPKAVPFGLTDIDNWFKTKDFNGYKPFAPFAYDESKEILEINYTDLHVGLLAWSAECGANFDLKIIEKRFSETIADIIERSRHRKFKKIMFITLGDILHVDNSHQTTTNGTFQQIDGRVPKIFDVAADMITNALENLLAELQTPIEYVYVAGNHDRDCGYYLAKTIETAFRREPNITFDIDPNPLKAKLYGKCLVGYCHGDVSRKNIGTWLITNFRKEFGKSMYAEIHSGHIHCKTEEIINAVKVISLPALCESSYWEHQQGYKSERGVVCYVWNEDTGKRETWTTMF